MPFYDVDICKALRDDFLEYTGHVMQERSLPDARDGLKDGARKILYSQYKNKNDYKHNFIKGQAAVGRVLIDGFLHGDASAYSTLVRLGKPFAVPYVLEEIQGNGGNQTNPDSHAAGRYLEIRQSELASYLFRGIEKNTIDEWYWNYSNTLELPRVLPTIGFYPIINGISGISVGLSTSIPPTNLREVNAAIIKLLKNKETPFEEIYCPPDLPMGGIIVNGNEVKESFKNGVGKAARIRAVIDYIPEKHMLIATHIPFSVYTDTIDEQLNDLINGEENPGIEKYIDATNDEGAKINIYLTKGANVNRIIQILYKKTSLESYFSINLIMLDNGRFPRVFSWKEALQTYIAHIRICKFKEIQYDLDKAIARKNIVDGLIKAYSIIDEVVALIRGSANPTEAADKLITIYSFNEEQAKAILAMKLSSLTKLDIVKLENEAAELSRKIEQCSYLLNTPTALDEELIKTLQEVADKFGDARRTKVLNIMGTEEEPVEIKEEEISVMLFDNNTLRIMRKDDLQGAKRGRKGTNVKPPKNATLINTLYSTNLGSIIAFTDKARMYNLAMNSLDLDNDYNINELLTLADNEKIILIIDATSFNAYKNLVTISKKGYIKKTDIREYSSRAKKGVIAAKLDDDDMLVAAFLSMNDEDKVFLASISGYYNFYPLSEVNSTGRATKGVRAMRFGEKEYIQSATIVKEGIDYKGILSLGSNGMGKITPLEDFTITSRGVKGSAVMALKDETLAAVHAVSQDKIFVTANNKAVLLDISTIPVQSRMTAGALLIDARNLKNVNIRIM